MVMVANWLQLASPNLLLRRSWIQSDEHHQLAQPVWPRLLLEDRQHCCQQLYLLE
jgi:hypothetical protein